jgi:mannosyl-oligosaccharide glucosidase
MSLTSGIRALKSAFDDRFRRSFPIAKDVDTPEYVSFAKVITANLLGGIGYFHGDSIIDFAFAQEWDDEDAFASASGGRTGEPTIVEPRGLLTATPSRSFFPRGFYW